MPEKQGYCALAALYDTAAVAQLGGRRIRDAMVGSSILLRHLSFPSNSPLRLARVKRFSLLPNVTKTRRPPLQAGRGQAQAEPV